MNRRDAIKATAAAAFMASTVSCYPWENDPDGVEGIITSLHNVRWIDLDTAGCEYTSQCEVIYRGESYLLPAGTDYTFRLSNGEEVQVFGKNIVCGDQPVSVMVTVNSPAGAA